MDDSKRKRIVGMGLHGYQRGVVLTIEWCGDPEELPGHGGKQVTPEELYAFMRRVVADASDQMARSEGAEIVDESLLHGPTAGEA
jgi:hypothetical protein